MLSFVELWQNQLKYKQKKKTRRKYFVKFTIDRKKERDRERKNHVGLLVGDGKAFGDCGSFIKCTEND